MKKFTSLLLPLVIAIILTRCTTSTPEKACKNAEDRKKIISELMKNDVYMNEVMVAMQAKHGDKMYSSVSEMAKGDKVTQEKMMNDMMAMCKTDAACCKMMMSGTMAMCDMDKTKCDMLMGSMKEHPKATQSMKEMGMCDMEGMNGMKMEEKK